MLARIIEGYVMAKPDEPGYYGREVNWDGSFKTKEDERSEQEVAKLIAAAWSCECLSYGKFSPIDWFFGRNGKLVAVGELKTRSHSSDKYATVFLNTRKFLWLKAARDDFEVPAVFIVRWTDAIKWIEVLKIDASTENIKIGGCKRIVKSRNDIEPVIEVPIAAMKALKSVNPISKELEVPNEQG